MSTTAQRKPRTKSGKVKPLTRELAEAKAAEWNAAMERPTPQALASTLSELGAMIELPGEFLSEYVLNLLCAVKVDAVGLSPRYRFGASVVNPHDESAGWQVGRGMDQLAVLSADESRLANYCQRAMLLANELESRAVTLDDAKAIRALAMVIQPADAKPVMVASGDREKQFVPLDEDLRILQALANRLTRVAAERLRVQGVGLRMVKDRLPQLEAAGLVDRAEGKRKGWAITHKGREMVDTARTLSAR